MPPVANSDKKVGKNPRSHDLHFLSPFLIQNCIDKRSGFLLIFENDILQDVHANYGAVCFLVTHTVALFLSF